MFREWNNERNQFILLIIIGGLLGWVAGYPGWGIVAVCVPYTLWMLKRTRILIHWLKTDKRQDPPESTGVWGAIFDYLHHQRRKNNEQLQLLYDIIKRAKESTNAIRDAVVVIDRKNNLEWWNDAAEKLLGLRRKSDIGQPITNLLRDPRFIHYFDAGEFDKSLEIPSSINPQITLQFQFTHFGQGELILVARDISRLHNLEQMRKDFVANVSHELRTPLTVIKGYLETFIDSIGPEQTTLIKGLKQMDQQAKRMELLVNDLLMLARLETEDSRDPLKPVAVAQLVQQVSNEALPLAESKQQTITLDLDESLYIEGVDSELNSAFSNLIVNAVNYTPVNGAIAIRWWRDNEGAYLEVEDNGIGIDSKHIPRLTERFYRADPSRYAKTGGTGLGLAIVKHVLLHHHGYLNISSTLGEGSVFTCHFPLQTITTPADFEEDANQSRKLSY